MVKMINNDHKAKTLEDVLVNAVTDPTMDNFDKLVIAAHSSMRNGTSIYGTDIYIDALKNALRRIKE